MSVNELRMADFPKCENCGGPIVPDDSGPVSVVTVVKDAYPNRRSDDGKCVGCGRPLWAPDEQDDD
jgi:hypothetical protein